MGIDVKKIKDKKINKLITAILFGILILVIVVPVNKQNQNMLFSDSSKDKTLYDGTSYEDSSYFDSSYYTMEKYYEDRVKNMLEESYGKGNIDVMIYMRPLEKDSFLYTANDKEYEVDGVLVIAKISNEKAISDITFAISALFSIPTHKVAVIISNQ